MNLPLLPRLHYFFHKPLAAWLALGLAAALSAGTIRAADAPASTAAVAPDMHTFTNTDGKTLNAVITNVTNDTVFLKRDDGGSVKADIATFADVDRAYIRTWIIKKIIQGGKQAFDFSATSAATTQTISYTGTAANPKATTIYSWDEGFTVKLANLQSLHLLKPNIQYNLVFVGTGGNTNYRVGHANVDEIPGSGPFSFQTDKLALTQHKASKTGAIVKESKMTGIWVRIYSQDNQLVQEWSSPASLMKSGKWVTVNAKGT